MQEMFYIAFGFDQDLGWCLPTEAVGSNAFEDTGCEDNSCGVDTNCGVLASDDADNDADYSYSYSYDDECGEIDDDENCITLSSGVVTVNKRGSPPVCAEINQSFSGKIRPHRLLPEPRDGRDSRLGR